MPRRRFRRSRGCGALRVGSAWRLARIILLASFVTNVHAFDAAPARRRDLLRFSDCATWLEPALVWMQTRRAGGHKSNKKGSAKAARGRFIALGLLGRYFWDC